MCTNAIMEMGNPSHANPLHHIRERFIEKRNANARYSIAAYARDLGVSASFLSRLLSGERNLTVKLAIQFATLFDLDPSTTEDWISSIVSNSNKNAKIPKRLKEKLDQRQSIKANYPVHFYEMERFKAVSQWYHFAILSLTYLKDFQSNSAWISKKLGITRIEAEDAIERMLNLGLLERVDGKLKQSKSMLYVDQKKDDLAIRQYHLQANEKAKVVLENSTEQSFDEQYFSGISLAFDRKRIPEFKKKLQSIAKELLRSTAGDNYTDIYHLNIQLFPVTSSPKPKRENNL